MTTLTGEGVNAFQLIAVKAALKLERAGLKHSSGRKLRPFWAKYLGLKPRDDYDKYIAAIEAKLTEIRASLHSQSAQPGQLDWT